MEITPGPLLKTIENPSELKKFSREQLHQVCDELRQYIIDVVSVHGGHFAASLGVVELSVALVVFVDRIELTTAIGGAVMVTVLGNITKTEIINHKQ